MDHKVIQVIRGGSILATIFKTLRRSNEKMTVSMIISM